ncbi:helix-turn-helix transcriptional regulator [Paraburkholderia sp. GAS82]|jgi:hypothetical protein|uniref:helix-turn-helix transcriptional regulator n=1 Tax=Paraburkholderia sp. GAS82 TaxID=3035137 RepID=UPI003D1BD48B
MQTNGNPPTNTDQSPLDGARAAVRAELARHGIDAMFVRVRDLSRLLGLPQSTIYAAIRQGRFFLPHRLMLASPVVHIDDLADWICGNPTSFGMSAAADKPLTPSPNDKGAITTLASADLVPNRQRVQATVPDEVADRIAEAAMAKIKARSPRA